MWGGGGSGCIDWTTPAVRTRPARTLRSTLQTVPTTNCIHTVDLPPRRHLYTPVVWPLTFVVIGATHRNCMYGSAVVWAWRGSSGVDANGRKSDKWPSCVPLLNGGKFCHIKLVGLYIDCSNSKREREWERGVSYHGQHSLWQWTDNEYNFVLWLQFCVSCRVFFVFRLFFPFISYRCNSFKKKKNTYLLA